MCHRWLEGRRQVKKLEWVDMAVPQQDVVSAVMREDFRFVGVHGDTPEVPGLREEEQHLPGHHGIRYLEGTAQTGYGKKHAELNEKARKYAERYNKLLALYLGKKPLLEQIPH